MSVRAEAEEAKQTAARALKRSRYFETVPEEKLRKLLELATLRSYRKGAVILAQGEANREVSIIVEGSVAVSVDGQFLCYLRRTGDIFGEMSVISGQPATATIEAVEDLQTLVLCIDQLEAIKSNASHELHYIFYEWFARVLSDKLYLTSQKAKLYEDVNNRLSSDLEAAKQVQQEVLVSNLTSIPGLPLTLRCEFATDLGGDLYGVLAVGEGRYGIFIGDVSGHGTPSSLLAVSVLSQLQNFSRIHDAPSEVIGAINRLWLATAPGSRFVTLFYGVYDSRTHELVYASGGHPPPLALRRRDVIEVPADSGIPLGLFAQDLAHFTDHRFQLQSGDRLVLYTDGVLETLAADPGEARVEDLAGFLRQQAARSTGELAEALFRQGHGSGGKRRDDFTVMLFEQTG